MLKRTKLFTFLALCMIGITLFQANVLNAHAAEYERIPLSLSGEPINEREALLINSITYAPLRALTESVYPSSSISYNESTKTATLIFGSYTLSVTTGYQYISINGRYFYGIGEVKNINGSLYVPVRPLARALGLDVIWNASTRSVDLVPSDKQLIDGGSYYKSDEVYWLSRIIEAEAGGEIFKGKIAVGNVVLNRVRSSDYPNTIYGVIFDFKHGIQFTPAYTGTVYNTPSKDSIIAAKICLEGYDVSDGALFFFNPRIATSFWISSTRKYAFTIGNHDFYY